MSAFLPSLHPESYRPHGLHDLARTWPETNCYVDVWIEILSALGHEPAAAMGFAVLQDYEGDQFTFFKYALEDLDLIYGIQVQELAIYDRVEGHCIEQIRRGRLPLVEVDSFYLPDTQGVSYRIEHTKSTIAINRLDTAGEAVEYFHNGGYYRAAGEDFRQLFRIGDEWTSATLFPYVEFAKLAPPPPPALQLQRAIGRLRHHLARRPQDCPFQAFRAELPAAVERLIAGTADFQKYAFNTARQFGANFDLLAAHLAWLAAAGGPKLEAAEAAAERISSAGKALQFQLARAIARKRSTGLEAAIDPVIEDYQLIMRDLDGALGGGPARGRPT